MNITGYPHDGYDGTDESFEELTKQLPTDFWPRNEKRAIAVNDSQTRMLRDLLRKVTTSADGEVRLTLLPGQRRALRGVLAEVDRISTRHV